MKLELTHPYLLKSLFILATFITTIILTRFTSCYLHRLAKTAILPSLIVLPLISLSRWIFWLIGISIILTILGADIMATLTGVLAVVGIGFVAVWSVLSNFFATILIIILKPFQIGDLLELPSEEIKGTAIDLNLGFTTLKTDEGTLAQIPNNFFFQKTLLRKKAPNPATSLQQQLENPQPFEP